MDVEVQFMRERFKQGWTEIVMINRKREVVCFISLFILFILSIPVNSFS